MAKVKLEFTGKNSVSKVFGRVQKDLKEFGKAHHDVMASGQKMVAQLAGGFDGKLANSIRGVGGIMQGLFTGGIWGAVGALATQAIGFVVSKWNEAKEAAKKFAEICTNDVVNAIGATKQSFSGIATDIAMAKAEIEGLAAVANGGVASAAEAKVHQLHIETLQKITDEVSEAGKKVILAQEAMEAANINGAAKVEAANNALKAAQDKVNLAKEKVAAADTRIAELTKLQQNVLLDNNEVVTRRTQLLNNIANIEDLYASGMISSEEYESKIRNAKMKLAKYEEEHAPVVKQLTEVERSLTEAKAAQTAATAEQEAATRAVSMAEYAKGTAVTAAERANMDAAAALQAARVAQERDTAATEAKTAEEQKRLAAANLQSAVDSELENIKLKALELGVESNEAVRLYNMAIKDGYEVSTAYAIAQAELNRAVSERAESEKKATESSKTGEGKGGSKDLVKDIAEGSAKGVGGTTVNTSVNTGEVGDGVDKADKVLTLSSLQREVRDDQRKVRDHNDKINQSSAAMKAYMTGKMSPEVAQKFADKIKQQGLTATELNKMVDKSLKTQLLSKSDLREQFKRIKSLDDRLKKMGLK